MDVKSLTVELAGLPVPQIRYFESIGSTNDEALAWAAAGAADGCLVAANQQTAGRGRLGRKWITQPGAALAFSLILHPTAAEMQKAGLFSPLGALAVSQAIESTLNIETRIKWPNDVLLHRRTAGLPITADWRKAVGILVEAAWLGSQLQGVVIGVGINVGPEAVPPDDQVLFPAISVEEAAEQTIRREALLRQVLQALFDWRPRLLSDAFRQTWEQRLAFHGEWVRVEGAGGTPVTGQVIGLDESGSLLLRTSMDETVTVAVGDVHLRLMD